jgi:ABC-type polysaccharide/polyol phosphate export permease
VKYLFEIALTVWMFSTSVVYPVQMVGGRLGDLLALNPMSPIIDAYRAVLLHGQPPPAAPLAFAAALSVCLLAVSWVVFHRAETAFAEHI